MNENLNIRYIPNQLIDKHKWDECVDNAVNGLVYAYSFYLDKMAIQWDALILDDYKAVMVLTWNKKYGIHYLYQPFLAAQLGVFGKNVNAEILSAFLNAIPVKFKYADIYLNHTNVYAVTGFDLYLRSNYVLDLNKPYAEIYDAYRDNIKRNIQKSLKQNCSVKTDIPVADVISLAKEQMQHYYKNADKEFDNFSALFQLLREKKKAVSYGILSAKNELLSSAIFFFSHNRAYYILVGNHPNGKTLGASHALIDAFIKDHAGENLFLDFEGSDIRNLAFFYSSFGAVEEKYAALKINRLPWFAKWLKK
jgi:hypothetical protein